MTAGSTRAVWILLPVAALALLGGGAIYDLAFRSIPVATIVATTGVVHEEIRAPGSVSSRTEVEVAARVAGVVERVLIDEGATVVAGQTLAELDEREMSGRAAVAAVAADSAEHGVTIAEAALKKARAELALARATHDRDAALFDAGHVTQAALDLSATAQQAAEASEASALATVATRRDDVRRLRAEAALAATVASYARITSPLAGLVTMRDVEVGATVAPGAALFRVVDDATVCVKTRVDVSQMDRITVGMPATILLASGDERTGTVARVAHEADPVTRDQEVRVQFDQPPAHLTLEEEAQVVLRAAAIAGVVLPGGAVVSRGGADIVMVARDGVTAAVPVTVRGTGQGSVVVSGIEEGETVVLEPDRVVIGQRVRPAVTD